ncbi:MAG: TNase-like domain-containing protein [Nitrospira sp.]|nr:MAG: TNase-like domain-containing protein [Nitrospira sp.]
MLHYLVPDSRLLSRLVLLLLVASPTTPALAVEEESQSTLHTYTPAIRNDPSPFHCTDCWDLKPDQRSSLPQHQTQRSRRGHHGRGLRPHKNPFAKKSHSFSRGLRSLPRHALSMGGFERTVEGWQVRTVDGDTIRYGTDRIRIRGYNAPELSEPGGREAALRLEQLLQDGTINIVPHGHDVYGRTLADVFVNGQNVADMMTEEGYGRRG